MTAPATAAAPRTITNAALGALDAALADVGNRTGIKGASFPFAVRQARKVLAPFVSALHEEEARIFDQYGQKKNGQLVVEQRGPIAIIPWRHGAEADGNRELAELRAITVTLPAGLPVLTPAMIDAADVQVTEGLLEALDPLVQLDG